jgi:peptide deformylase
MRGVPMEILTYPASVLSRPARRITRREGLDLHALHRDMAEAMEQNHGVGLAAPQVGLSLRFFIAHDSQAQQTRGFVNPQIVRTSQETIVRGEGCLSFPELYGDVERSSWIVMRYQNLDFRHLEERFEGHFARVLQHELDHLNGVLLIDRAVDGLHRWEEGAEDEEGAEAVEGETGMDGDGGGSAVEMGEVLVTPARGARPER